MSWGEMPEATIKAHWGGFLIGLECGTNADSVESFEIGLRSILLLIGSKHPEYSINFEFCTNEIVVRYIIGGGKGSRMVKLPWGSGEAIKQHYVRLHTYPARVMRSPQGII